MAEVWSECEPFGLRWEHLTGYLDHFQPPCLVVGSGLGPLTRGLLDAGRRPALGIDHSFEMALRARSKRAVETLVAALPDLPLSSRQFRTVIVATGVLDPTDRCHYQRNLDELSRMVAPDAVLLIALFQPPAEVVEVATQLGLMQDSRQRNDRICVLWQYRRTRSKQAQCLSEWTGCSLATAQSLLARHQGFLQGWLGLYTRLADVLNEVGKDASAFLEQQFSWSLGALSPEAAVPPTALAGFNWMTGAWFREVATRVDLYRRATSSPDLSSARYRAVA